ncbi:centromeric protein E [Pancytospora philotis]|nr:centromeric protein E [Pancytospora philotis]
MAGDVEVHIRVRVHENDGIWNCDGNSLSYAKDGRATAFSCFDSVFCAEKTAEVYAAAVAQGIGHFNSGENVTIMAYGQTGTGKTYTMLGEDRDGFIYLALADILPQKLRLSYVEVYNERVYDLKTRKELTLYTKDQKTQIHGLEVEEVDTQDAAYRFLSVCAANKKINATEFNIKSSRSHTILQIYSDDAVLSFIDLAGCEKMGSEELRNKEGAYINRSLLALGKVVASLSAGHAAKYRDSKLTRILQESLNTRANIIAFCMISTSERCLWESISTLQFAARLSKIDLKGIETEVKETERPSLLPANAASASPEIAYHAVGFGGSDASIDEASSEEDVALNIDAAVSEEEKALDLYEFNEEIRDSSAHSFLPSFDLESDNNCGQEAPLERSKVVSIDFYNEYAPVYADNDAALGIYEKRIESLEGMVAELLRKSPNKLMGTIFVLEKQAFSIRRQILRKGDALERDVSRYWK